MGKERASCYRHTLRVSVNDVREHSQAAPALFRRPAKRTSARQQCHLLVSVPERLLHPLLSLPHVAGCFHASCENSAPHICTKGDNVRWCQWQLQRWQHFFPFLSYLSTRDFPRFASQIIEWLWWYSFCHVSYFKTVLKPRLILSHILFCICLDNIKA